MKKIYAGILSLILGLLMLVLTGCGGLDSSQSSEGADETLLVFAGAASKPPTELAAEAFSKKTGVDVELVFGGSGYVLSQMELAKMGDIYFPGSSDFMELAKAKELVFPETERKVVYLVNAINVKRGNPKQIYSLQDLLRPGLRVVIANPEGVCVGLYAVEIVESALSPDEIILFKANLVNFPESCEKTATSISLETADAVIGWRVFEHWDAERIETVALAPSEIIRVGYIPVAVSTYTKNRDLAQSFVDYLLSEEGQSFYKEYSYFTTPEEAFSYIGEERPVGGNYRLPESWLIR